MARVGLGAVFNVIAVADTVTVPLTRAAAVSFVTFEDDGSTIATITELDSTAVNSAQALDVDNDPFKGPGVGGAWTAMAEQDATLDLADDATNDTMVFSVHGSQLSDGYDSVQVSVDGGVVMAILHGLYEQKDPPNLTSSLTA